MAKPKHEVMHLDPSSIRLPGSLLYNGTHTDVTPIIEVYRYDETNVSVQTFDTPQALPQEVPEGSVTWINLTGLNHPEFISYFGQRFGIHEMHLEDIVQVNRHAKVDIEEDYVMTEHYMMYRDQVIHHESIALFLLPGVVLSFQEYPGDVFEPVRQRIRQDGSKVRSQREDYLYYLLVDRLVDEAVAVLKDLIYQLDDMERLLLDENQIDMRQAYEIKRELLNVKTAIYPLDGLFEQLLSEKNQVLSREILPYMHDIEDHIDLAIVDISRAMDTIENMNQSNMAKLSNQMNSIMKVLTIFSAIFIPLNFITGMYGMNLKHMPFLDHPSAFFGFVSITLVIVSALIWYFKKKQWF